MAYKFNPFTGNFDDFNGPNGEFTSIDVDGDITIGGTGRVSFPLGLAATPSLYPDTDTNTGIYSPGADQLAVATNGTGRLFVDASGNVSVDSGAFYVDAVNNSVGINTASPNTYGANSLIVNNSTLTINQDGASEPILQFRSGTATQLGRIQYPPTGLRFVNVSGAAETMRITSAGLVGIGTSAPSQLLSLASASNPFINIQDTTSATGSKAGISFTMTSVSGSSGARIEVERLGASAQSSLSFYTGGTLGTNVRALTIDQFQRVGIGTTSPGYTLVLSATSANIEINDFTSPDATSETGIRFSNNATNHALLGRFGSQDFRISNTGNIVFATGGISTANEKARLTSSGQLLVGTSTARNKFFNTTYTPQLQLEGVGQQQSMFSLVNSVADNGGPVIGLAKQRSGSIGGNTIVNSGDNVGHIDFFGSDGTEMVALAEISARVDGTPGANDMPGRIVLSTTAAGAASPTERMRIGNKGNTTITSVADNDAALRVDSNGTSGTQYGIYIETGNDQNDATRTFLGCVGGATTRAQIRSNGGLANYQANDVNLSDINVKKDISPAGDTWDCVKQWEIVNYRYNDQSDDADLNLGVIAQQVAESCPEVITVFQEAKEATEDAPAQEERLGVKEQQMYWMAIKALQEAIARIETLETEVAALKGA